MSSEEQARGGYGLEFQEQDIRTFCERNNLQLVHMFRDEGFSGATAERPGFQSMMAAAREHQFDLLVVWKLDRLFRDTKLTLQTVDELASLGIECRSVQESFTHDSNGRFLLTIFAAGAEKERRDITLRMLSGRIASARRGTHVSGGGTPPYGYSYNRTTKRLEIDPVEAEVVHRMYTWLVNERLSLFKIQKRLNEQRIPTKFDRLGRKKPTGSTGWWRQRTVGRILSNEVYTGTFTFRKYKKLGSVSNPRNLRPKEDWIEIQTPIIIPKSIFDQAQRQLRRNAQNSPRRTKVLYLLSKLLVCGHDGSTMQAAIRKQGNGRAACKYYFCYCRFKWFSPVTCRSRAVAESRIAPVVWSKVIELLTDPERLIPQAIEHVEKREEVAAAVAQQSTLRRQRDRLSGRADRLVELYLGEAITKDFFSRERRTISETIAKIDRDLKGIESRLVLSDHKQDLVTAAKRLYLEIKTRLATATDEVKREIFNLFIQRVVITGQQLAIEVLLPETISFAGQHSHELSRKTMPLITLRATLVPNPRLPRVTASTRE